MPIILLKNGDRFQGNKDKNNQLQGWAKYWLAKGDKFEGLFTNGQYNGLGCNI